MPRPNLPAGEKRNHDVEVAYNDLEYEMLLGRAKDSGRSVARFVREISLSDDRIQTVSPNGKIAAQRARKISELIHQIYVHRVKLTENTRFLKTVEPQTDSHYSTGIFTQEETNVWREITAQLNELNAELLGYADNDN